MKRLFLTAAVLLLCIIAGAQDGTVTYALPRTCITLEVEAVKETFFAGPYAKFSEKYLGVEARQEDGTSYQLQSVRMVPCVEADPSVVLSAALPKGGVPDSFFSLTSQGLISIPAAASPKESEWRFTSLVNSDFAGKEISSNLTSEAATLYRNVKEQSAYNKISVQQSMVVEKSAEAKAKETADMIFELRRTRVQIVTGDTDASFSGEAMAAALDEIDRLEKEYTSLFVGYSNFQTQKFNFDVIPQKGTNMYIAFRLSETEGLLPAESASGRPYVLNVTAAESLAPAAVSKSKTAVLYRIPAVCTVRLMDGATALFQTRVPVYQFGTEAAYPMN